MLTQTAARDLPLSPEPVDPSVLASLLELGDGDDDILRELIDLFLSDTPPRLLSARQTLANGDGPALSRAAHALKSSSANLGALNMAKICDRLELLGRAGDLGSAAPLIDLLDREFAAARAVLEHYRAI